MSSILFAMGQWATRAKFLVLAIWIAVLALLGAGAGLFSTGANAPISIPGTESQEAIDSLARTFPQVSGSSARIIVVAPEGTRVDEPVYADAIVATSDHLENLEAVKGVTSPFAAQAPSDISPDGRAAIIQIQIAASTGSVPPATETGIIDATNELQKELPEGTQVEYGGDLFSAAIPGFSIAEALGVVIAFIVLIFTLGSLIAAGMPLLLAILGVGISVAGIYFTTAFIDMTSTTPMLALMLGLAVGIDYTLFIVSRHQEQLREGVPLRESIARSTATSGSAVVFAGLTVIIALIGLSVARIPFLTALGVAAACGVAVAVVIAVTLTPAVLAMAGKKILPRKQRHLVVDDADDAAEHTADTPAVHGDAPTAAPEASAHPEKRASRATRFYNGWVKAVTAKPIITILVVLVGLGAVATPAMDLRLGLPGADSLEPDNPARITYELTAEHFGAGSNATILLTGSIIGSTDPLGLMDELADEVRKIPGVADVPLATPNEGADTGIIQVTPVDGPSAESTTQLVHDLRAHHDEWLKKYGVSLAVTGFTAVGIDVSQLLFEALLPFGILVVGLSFVLLAMVFRSVWVPVKATLGYLLSVGVAFGAVVAVFQWGWFDTLLNVHHTGPVLSFMPIILMGVLFGLAMDYEVFLVSRIREEIVHGAEPAAAIRRGFIGSGPVVTAAAIIMFAVFAAFVPEGDPSIKVIAFGLAVGVFVDAFIVRMTLVPAVLKLLGDRAWKMPKWLDKLLPSFDVEGEGLAREMAHATWPADQHDAIIATDAVRTLSGHEYPNVRVGAGQALVLDPRETGAHELAEILTGRGRAQEGTLKVAGLLLPERAASIRTRSAWATPATLREALGDRPTLLLLDLRGDDLDADQAHQVRSQLTARNSEAAHGKQGELTVIYLGTPEQTSRVLPLGVSTVEPGQGAPDGGAAAQEHTDPPHPAAPAAGSTTTLSGAAR